MDGGCRSSSGSMDDDSSSISTSASTGINGDSYLNHLNKISHKISKPIRRQPIYQNQTLLNSQLINDIQTQNLPPPPQQPPVYNINKSDFRDVVQRLTGSPARMANPPPIQQLKPSSSRLHKIRPPPLAQISNRFPPPPMNPSLQTFIPGGTEFCSNQHQIQSHPLSPLPPFPAVHSAAESPISAYMRFLRSSIPGSPRWNIPAPAQPQLPLPPPYPAAPSSPLSFGCLPSPKSPYTCPAQLGFQAGI